MTDLKDLAAKAADDADRIGCRYAMLGEMPEHAEACRIVLKVAQETRDVAGRVASLEQTAAWALFTLQLIKSDAESGYHTREDGYVDDSEVSREDVLKALRENPDGLESGGLEQCLKDITGKDDYLRFAGLAWIRKLEEEGLIERHVPSCPGVFRLKLKGGI